MPLERQYSAICSVSKARWPPTWTRIAARGLCRSALRSKSSKDMQRSSLRQSTNSTLAPAPTAASGVAMKVLDGQRTVSPSTPANSSAARAPPAQLERPTLGSLFHSAQRASKAASLAPSDHCSESRTSVHSSNSRGRSRWSKPIANLVTSGRDVSAAPTVAPSSRVLDQGVRRGRIGSVAEGGARLAANSERTLKESHIRGHKGARLRLLLFIRQIQSSE